MMQTILGLRLGQWLWFGALAAAAITVAVAVFRWWNAGGRLPRKWISILAVTCLAWIGLAAFTRHNPMSPTVRTSPM